MTDEPKYRNKKWLREQYVEEKRSTYEIADQCGCHSSTVSDWLKKHGIESRSRAEAADARLADAEWLREQYVNRKKKTREIADICECSHSAVVNWLDKHDIKTRSRGRELFDERLRDSEWLQEQYKEHRKSVEEISEICDCSPSVVYRRFREQGIEIDSSGSRVVSDLRLKDAEWLCNQYIGQEKDMVEIAEQCGCTASTVSRWLKRHDIKTRGPAETPNHGRKSKWLDGRLDDREWLHEQYAEQKATCADIAAECECSPSTVQRRLKEHGIETQPGRRQAKYDRLLDPEWLHEQYVEKEQSGHEIAEEVGCGFRLVYDWLENHGIELQDYRGRLSGEDHPRWNGGERPYGPGWNERKRQAVRSRDNHTCQDPRCSVTQGEHLNNHGEKLHVHHLRKAREIEDAEQRNAKSNLITLCRECHRRWEKIADTGLVPQLGGTQATLGEVTDDE